MLFQNHSVRNVMPPVMLNGCNTETVECIKFLGIHIDSNTNWKSQISVICNKLYKKVGLCIRLWTN